MNIKVVGVLLGVFALFIISASIFVINERQRGMLLRLGKLERDSAGAVIIYSPGLHFKYPMVHRVVKVNARILNLDGPEQRILTKEKKDVMVDSYVKWRVRDFEQFYVKTGGDMVRAEVLLGRKVNNTIRASFGQRTIAQVVSGKRDAVMTELREKANESAQELGLEVIDVRVKQINLPAEVSNSVFNRMRSERDRIARQLRSEGKEQAEAIQADADANVTVIIATANKSSKEQRGEGDATAAGIFAEVYSKNAEFYYFYRSLQAYQGSFNSKSDMLLIKPEGDFFTYFNQSEVSKGK